MSGPRHAPYPVWLEKFTVCTGTTSTPMRCSGKTAAELPTCPWATADWMDKTFILPTLVTVPAE
ncbi:hypothetical protein Kisp01_20440 [Kineosporia sp. NBRC 101677]|nr:hypothetical protein Kisp01_20440 [Kineosporia sp. NBRC 101677]